MLYAIQQCTEIEVQWGKKPVKGANGRSVAQNILVFFVQRSHDHRLT